LQRDASNITPRLFRLYPVVVEHKLSGRENIFSVHIACACAYVLYVRTCTCVSVNANDHCRLEGLACTVPHLSSRTRRAKTYLSTVCRWVRTCGRSRSCEGYRYKTFQAIKPSTAGFYRFHDRDDNENVANDGITVLSVVVDVLPRP